MLFYRAALLLSRQTLTFVSRLIRAHRRQTGSVWRTPKHVLGTGRDHADPRPQLCIAHVGSSEVRVFPTGDGGVGFEGIQLSDGMAGARDVETGQ